MRKVLIISYYWPPAGGGGVQRWLKFVKYLPQTGWAPVVYTAENADYPVLDPSLQSEIPLEAIVLRHPIWEPYRSVRKVASGGDQGIAAGFIRHSKSESIKTKTIQWIRGNLIIPDARRFWISASVNFLNKYLSENPVDVIVSSGPPHSMHLIARRVARHTRIPWLADFRDPWVNMDNADKFRMTRLAKGVHAMLERKVLQSADAVITVSWYLSAQYQKIRGSHVGVITNGFDHTDFINLKQERDHHFIIGHYGTFGDDRNPSFLWEALEELCQEDATFSEKMRIELCGPTDVMVLDEAKRRGFADRLMYTPYMSHERVLIHMKKASVLLVILNQNANEEGRVTGKIFEYVACARPVLGIGSPTSDCARVINESGTGVMCAFSDKKGMKEFIGRVYSGDFPMLSASSESVMQYSRKQLTSNLAELLNQMTSR